MTVGETIYLSGSCRQTTTSTSPRFVHKIRPEHETALYLELNSFPQIGEVRSGRCFKHPGSRSVFVPRGTIFLITFKVIPLSFRNLVLTPGEIHTPRHADVSRCQ